MMLPLYLFEFFFLYSKTSLAAFASEKDRVCETRGTIYIGFFVLLVSLFMDCLYIKVNTRNFLEFYFET